MSSGGSLRLEAFLPYRLSVASNAVSGLIARAYRERFGLSVPDWRLVAILHDHPGSTQQDLVRLTLMDKVAVSRSAGALERRGLIGRRADCADGRAWRLELTPAGHDLHAHIAPLAQALETRLLADLPPDDVPRLHAMLRTLEDTAKRLS